MKKVIGLLLAAAIVVGVIPHARSLGAPTPPKGVAMSDWIPFGDAAGFVVTHDSPHWDGAPSRRDSVRGYFVIHRGGEWKRIEAGNEPDLHSARHSVDAAS